MNEARRHCLLVLAIIFSIRASAAADPKIGLIVDYQATAPTRVKEIWFDGRQLIGMQGATMFVSARSPKEFNLSGSGTAVAPLSVRASWSYQVPGEVGEGSGQFTLEDGSVWNEASAEIAVRSEIEPDALRLLREEPNRHRFKLVLIFDRDELHIRWQVQQWR